jgi:hypothetical protein
MKTNEHRRKMAIQVSKVSVLECAGYFGNLS